MRMEVWMNAPEVKLCDVCGFDVYTDSNLCEDCLEDQIQEEIKEEMSMNAVELLKAELCSRYGINPEQIVVSVSIDEVESVELADQIKNDYAVKGKVLDFLRSYNGYNQILPDINSNQYLVSADHGSHARKDNIINIDVRTKEGVLK